MRCQVCLRSAVFVAFVLFGCDTDDPLVANVQNVELAMTANNATTAQFAVWNLYQDNDDDDVPDDLNGNGIPGEPGDVSLWCERTGAGNPASVPWGYSLRVRVLRAGATVTEQITSDAAATDGFNRAPYDTPRGTHGGQNLPILLTHAAGACSDNPLIRCNPNAADDVCDRGQCVGTHACSGDPGTTCDPANLGTTCPNQGAGFCTPGGFCSDDPGLFCTPTCLELGLGACLPDVLTRQFKWSNVDRLLLTAASRDLLRADTNAINDACAGDPVCESDVEVDLGGLPLDPPLGVCPGQDIAGDPGMDPGNPLSQATDTETTLGFTLNRGDTLFVEARRTDTIPDGGIQFIQPPGLRFRLSIDGTLLGEDEVVGNSSSTDDSPNVSFSFTLN